MKNLKLASFINLIILCAGIFIASLIGFSLVRLKLAVKILFALIIALLVTFFAYKKESAVSVRVKNSQNSIKRLNEVMHILNTCAGDEIQEIFLKFHMNIVIKYKFLFQIEKEKSSVVSMKKFIS